MINVYGNINEINDICMDDKDINIKYNMLVETINKFSEKYNIYINVGHSWYSSPKYDDDWKNVIEGADIVQEFWLSKTSNNPEFDKKCFDKKMCFIGINNSGNVYLENSKSIKLYEVECKTTFIDRMLFHYILKYLKLTKIPKTYNLVDFIKK